MLMHCIIFKTIKTLYINQHLNKPNINKTEEVRLIHMWTPFAGSTIL